MCLTGHNSYKGCRFCNIRGIYTNHVYFPTMPPIGEDDNYITYDPNNLPMRNHEQFKEQIQQLGRANSNNVQEFGVYNFNFFKFK